MFGGGFRKNYPMGPGGRRKKRVLGMTKTIQKAVVGRPEAKRPLVTTVRKSAVKLNPEPAVKPAKQKAVIKPVRSERKSRVSRRDPATWTPPGIPHDPPVGRQERSGIAVVGRFSAWSWGQHPDESYMADALERIGTKVYRVSQESLSYPPREALKAEWALFTGNPQSFMHMAPWQKTHPTALWTLDWLPGYSERVNIIQAGRRATLFLTSDRYNWPAHGVTNHAYLPGACEGRVARFDPRPTTSCAFVGSLYSERRRKIAQIVRDRGGTVLDNPSSWIYGEALSRFVQGVKVVVGDNVVNDVPGYWSTRNYVIPGAGGFLLTPRVPDLDMQLSIGKEIAVYSAIEELGTELDRWIRDDAGREAIRCAGYERVRKDHTWNVRARTFLDILAGKAGAHA
jgi:hypothetical protein